MKHSYIYRILKSSTLSCMSTERNKTILTWIILNIVDRLHNCIHIKKLVKSWEELKACVRNTKLYIYICPPLSFKKCPWSLIISPGKMDRKTDRHKSRFRQYIGRAKDWVEWTLEQPLWRNVRTSRIVCCFVSARQQ
jgi:hypothetical protein